MHEMRAKAAISLRFPSQSTLHATLQALKPETRATLSRRCRTQIQTKGNYLTLTIEAHDTSALRAAINSYLRWMLLTQTIVDSVDLAGAKGKDQP